MAAKIGKSGKQRTNTAAKKRFKKTGSGKWKGPKAAGKHLLLQKSTRQKKLQAKGILLSSGDSKTVNRLIPIS